MNLLAAGATPGPAEGEPAARHTAFYADSQVEDIEENNSDSLGRLEEECEQDETRSYLESPSSVTKDKSESPYEDIHDTVPPRLRILELLQPGDPGREAIEAMVRPLARRYHRPPPAPLADADCCDTDYAEDSWHFLVRSASRSATPSARSRSSRDSPLFHRDIEDENADPPTLADELREAEAGRATASPRPREHHPARTRDERERSSAERERLARIALAVEEDEADEADEPEADEPEAGEAAAGELAAAARRLDVMLAESRDLHHELAEIHDDMQAETRRAAWVAAAARALLADTRALRFLDDVLALLRGDASALRGRVAWPFALGHRDSQHNYIV